MNNQALNLPEPDYQLPGLSSPGHVPHLDDSLLCLLELVRRAKEGTQSAPEPSP